MYCRHVNYIPVKALKHVCTFQRQRTYTAKAWITRKTLLTILVHKTITFKPKRLYWPDIFLVPEHKCLYQNLFMLSTWQWQFFPHNHEHFPVFWWSDKSDKWFPYGPLNELLTQFSEDETEYRDQRWCIGSN